MQILFHPFGLLPPCNFSTIHRPYFLLPDCSENQSSWLFSPHWGPGQEAQDNLLAGGGGGAQQPLSFSTAVVNVGFAGKLQFWLNVHFLEKCLLSRGILTFWWRPKRVWPKHLGFWVFFWMTVKTRYSKSSTSKFQGEWIHFIFLQSFPRILLCFPINFSVCCECISSPYNLLARWAGRLLNRAETADRKVKRFVQRVSPQSNQVAWKGINTEIIVKNDGNRSYINNNAL